MLLNGTETNVNVIGIAGVAGSGKDTFGRLVADVFEDSGGKVNFLSFTI